MTEQSPPPDAAEAPQAVPELIQITDFNQLATLFADWHRRKVMSVSYLKTMPPGQVVQIGEDPEIEISGDIHKGFMLGLEFALMEFGSLPFNMELEPAPANAG